MKKFLAYFVTILFLGVISLTVMAFIDDDPKKQKSETAKTEQCEKHDETASGAAETKACCKEAGKTASGECAKADECKHHSETTTDNK